MALRFVTATRSTMADFKARSPLCHSLRRASDWSRIELTVVAENRSGLPLVFNKAIDEAAAEDILVFIHDDVWVDDWFIERRLEEALGAFDVIGVAGNARRTPRQLTWWLIADTNERDANCIRGAVAHGAAAQAKVASYGPTPAQVQLLDGVLTAARAGTLQQHGVRFDPEFDFHFYDLDFCRSCTAAGLRIGTWPIAITHASHGNPNTPAWNAAYQRYLKKWRE